MTAHVTGIGRHIVGIAAAMIAAGALILMWEYAIDYLLGTPFEELRYLIFASAAIGALSGVHTAISKLLK